MIATLDYPKNKSDRLVTSQIETVQEDLSRLSGVFIQLGNLPSDTLGDMDLYSDLETLHRSLTRFENRCATLSACVEVEQDSGVEFDSGSFRRFRPADHQWGAVRRSAKRANQLADQLTQTLKILRVQGSEETLQACVPDDIQRLNLSVFCTVNRLIAEWNQPLD